MLEAQVRRKSSRSELNCSLWVVVPIVAVHGVRVPWGKVVVEGVPVVPARQLPNMLCQLPAVLEPERVAVLANQARIRFRAAA